MSFGIPLTTDEIDNFLKKDGLECILYDSLQDKSLDDLFMNKAQYAIILYTSDYKDIGHFVCIGNLGKQKNGRFLIDYFEPSSKYKYPDECNIPLNKSKERQNRKYLSEIFKDCDVMINNHALQDISSSVCGKWCISRCISYPTLIDDYASIFLDHKKYRPDEIINMLIKVTK